MATTDSTERRLVALVRLGLGLAAFAVAFDHTLAWLADNKIDGPAGWVTAACIDLMAAVCLRQLLTATHASLRLIAASGLAVATLLSGIAQWQSNDGGGAGPVLSLVPLGAFAFLQLAHEVEQRVTRDAVVAQPAAKPVRNRAAQPRPAVTQVAQPTAQRVTQPEPVVAQPAGPTPPLAEPGLSKQEQARRAAIAWYQEHDETWPSAGALEKATGVSRGTCTIALREAKRLRRVA